MAGFGIAEEVILSNTYRNLHCIGKKGHTFVDSTSGIRGSVERRGGYAFADTSAELQELMQCPLWT